MRSQEGNMVGVSAFGVTCAAWLLTIIFRPSACIPCLQAPTHIVCKYHAVTLTAISSSCISTLDVSGNMPWCLSLYVCAWRPWHIHLWMWSGPYPACLHLSALIFSAMAVTPPFSFICSFSECCPAGCSDAVHHEIAGGPVCLFHTNAQLQRWPRNCTGDSIITIGSECGSSPPPLLSCSCAPNACPACACNDAAVVLQSHRQLHAV